MFEKRPMQIMHGRLFFTLLRLNAVIEGDNADENILRSRFV
jgi:hypothetical protein